VDGFEHLFSGLILCQPDPEIRRRPFLGFPADDGAKVKGCFFFKKKKTTTSLPARVDLPA
jgi:hypothetical protein